MDMSHKIGLYHDMIRCGQIDLDSLFVMEPADYTCEPHGVVSGDDVRQIARTLRRSSDVRAGVIGDYDWREE
jgi:hypothetical protein